MRNEDDISDPDEEVPAPARSLGIHPPALNSEGSQQRQRDTGTPSARGHGPVVSPDTMTSPEKVSNTISDKVDSEIHHLTG